jgi:outer membrane protein
MREKIIASGIMLMLSVPFYAQTQWTLKDCISYALEHNIQLQKNKLQKESSTEDTKQAKAQLLPSLNFSTGHNLSYRPFPEGGGTSVTNGYVDTKVNKTSYNGNYNIGANWTVWNGNKNNNTVKQSEITEQQADLTAQTTANSIQEQITQLYVQILYNTESIKVYEQVLEISKANLKRGQEMLAAGSMAKAEVAQLEAQAATDEYNLVNAQGQVARYKLQLKQLLELTDSSDFDIVIPQASDEAALAAVPAMADVYGNALVTRPEIKNAQLGIEASKLQEKIAKAGYMPTIGVSGSVGASTTSVSDNSWTKQMKSNLTGGLGVNLSIPLFDQRSTKTSIRKAKIQQQEQQLDLQDKQKELWSTIEGYWLDANTNQARFKAAKVSTESAKESYELVSEQFKEGLKNIQELTTGKTTLLNAEQSRLESKYTTILSMQMLNFYNGGDIDI